MQKEGSYSPVTSEETELLPYLRDLPPLTIPHPLTGRGLVLSGRNGLGSPGFKLCSDSKSP